MTAAAPPHILLCSRTPASTRLAIARCGADAPGGEASQNSLTRYGLYSSKWAWKWEWVHRPELCQEPSEKKEGKEHPNQDPNDPTGTSHLVLQQRLPSQLPCLQQYGIAQGQQLQNQFLASLCQESMGLNQKLGHKHRSVPEPASC